MSEQQAVFSIEKIYVKDMSLELPNAPAVFLQQAAPEVEVQLSTGSQPVGEGYFESQLTVTVTAKIEDKVSFLVEVTEAGIFEIRNIPDTDMGPILGITCPNILFPYVREVISDTVSRAGFPPVLLNPINFEALYQQQLQEGAGAPQQ
jgi:preprotein translocase subunit SecB